MINRKFSRYNQKPLARASGWYDCGSAALAARYSTLLVSEVVTRSEHLSKNLWLVHRDHSPVFSSTIFIRSSERYIPLARNFSSKGRTATILPEIFPIIRQAKVP